MGFEYGIHSVSLHTLDTGTEVKLGGVSAMGMPMNTDISEDDNGQIYDSFTSIIAQAPTPRFTTRSVAAALAAIPQNGVCIRSDGTHPGVKFYGEAKSDCQSGEPGAAEHLSYLMDTGLIVPISLSAARRQPARLSVEIDAITPDGLNAPFAADYSETLPTGLNIDEYILGAMRIGNVIWDDARSMELTFNVERGERDPMLGGIWPDRASRRKARPRLTVTARDPRKLDDASGIPFVGKSGTHLNTILYFRKRLNGAALVDVATTEHFRMTMSGIVYFDNPFEASGNAPAETTVMISGRHDGTNAPIIFTFGVAYDDTP